MFIPLEFRMYTVSTGWVLTDPNTISAFTRPDGGGGAIEVFDDLLPYRKETGVYYAVTGEGYVSGQWYEIVVTATIGGEVITQMPRKFCYMEAFTPTPIPVEGARLVQAAIHIVNRLNEHSFSQSFTAIRSYSVLYDMRELKTLKVTVIPATRTRATLTRDIATEEDRIDVAVQKRSPKQAEADALVYLVEEMIDWISVKHTYGHFKLTGLENNPAIAAEHIKPYNVFTSIISAHLKEGVQCSE